MTKDKIFHPKRTLKVAGKLFDLSTATTMGILNLTDDSFYDGGQYVQKEKTLLRIGQMLDEGATIIDIGAYSSRPGALYVSEAKEWNRLEQLLPIVNKEFPKAIVSIASSVPSNVGAKPPSSPTAVDKLRSCNTFFKW